jgi:hypothetical protein
LKLSALGARWKFPSDGRNDHTSLPVGPNFGTVSRIWRYHSRSIFVNTALSDPCFPLAVRALHLREW